MTISDTIEDHSRAWFTVYSDLLDRPALSEATGIQEPTANSLGRVPKGRGLSLQSDLFIPPTSNMREHLTWLLTQIKNNKKLCSFLQNGRGRSVLFLYITTDQDAAYVEIPPDALQQISELGCELQVKVETES